MGTREKFKGPVSGVNGNKAKRLKRVQEIVVRERETVRDS